MQFELTEALLDDILFSMEDQEGIFYIDCQEGVVVNGDEEADAIEQDNENRFINLPEWDSSSGFRLMERFAAAFRNPLIRNELCAALNQGKGVFRAFKNTISLHPEAEKLWFSYKEREMKREVIRWYNALREEWGLQKIGFEPEETADLVREDFQFRNMDEHDRAAVMELHASCRKTDPVRNCGESPAMVAETGNGEFAGYISTEKKDGALYIRALEVKPEYRGLGVGKTLLAHLLQKANAPEITHVYFDLPAEYEGFARALIREGFASVMTRYCLTVKD